MPFFIYKALNSAGGETQGEIQADNKKTAIDYLKRDKLTPLYIEEKGKFEKSQFSIFSNFTIFERGINATDRIFLTRHLAAILKSGINLREALEVLQEDVQKPILKKILIDAKKNLEKGQPLSMTFATYDKYFSPVFIGLIRAGESSGTLEDTLENLGEQLQRDYELRKKVQSAMIYPAILMFASSLIIVLLLTFVMPRLTKALLQTKVKLPAITRFFIGVSDILSVQPILTIAVFIGAIIFLVLFFRHQKGKQIFLKLLQKIPISRELIKRLALARFSRTFLNLLKSGMPALEAIKITAQTVGNKNYEDALLSIAEDIKKGSPLNQSFKKRIYLFPQLVVSIIGIGERTGTLERALKTISDYYEEEVDRILKNLVSLLEPLMLVIMGFVIAGIALSILLPIYQLVSSFR
ncbi:MAG: type II secretion system F family protein [Patescibacteria group bacterium]